jgi:tetratricopeptide (TPR) repeat protein
MSVVGHLCAQTSAQAPDACDKAEKLLAEEKWTEVLTLTESTRKTFDAKTSPSLRARCDRLQGEALILAAEYDSAVGTIQRGMAILEKNPDAKELAALQSALGRAYRYQGSYELASYQFHASLEFAEQANDSVAIMSNRLQIAIIKYLNREYPEAEEEFLRSYSFFSRNKDQRQAAFCQSLLCLTYTNQDRYEEAIQAGETSLRIRQEIGDLRGEGESLNNLALVYKAKKDFKMALQYLEASQEALTKGQDLRMIAVIQANIADCQFGMGDKELALQTYLKASEIAQNNGQKYDLSQIQRKLARAYENMGQLDKAIEYYKDYVRLRDTLLTAEKTKAIKEMEVKYETERQKEENVRFREKAEAERQHFWALLAGFVLLLVIASLVVALLVNRVRQSKKLLEKEKQLFVAREELKDLELKQTRSELQINETKLQGFTASILKKNELIEDLENQLKSLQVKDEDGEIQRLARLEELLRMKILTEEDWEVFKRHFEQVHQGFLTHLRSKLPDLTTGDERLFILLKLNLHSKEISDILGVSPDSVKKARYRLRKKLNLSEEDSLEDYITSFS